MKLTSLALFVLTLTASVAYAEGSASASISGKWSNTATHENFSINKKGIVGRNAKSCDGQVEQILSMEKGEKWLAEAAKLAAEKDIPQSQYDELANVIDRGSRQVVSFSCKVQYLYERAEENRQGRFVGQVFSSR